MTTISSIDARFAQTQVGVASAKVTASVQNLVSGNKADANVADLSVGTVLASRVNTLRVAVGNAGQGKSLLNTAKGALTTILGLLQQQKSLSVKAADDSLSDNERGFLNQEFQAIVTQIDRIASTTNFNGKKLLDGSIDGTGASIANVATTTGITNEQYSLLQAKDTTASGTVATGNLQDSLATVGRNLITFTYDGSNVAGTRTFKLDSDALAGTTAVQSLDFDVALNTTSAAAATAFVTAVNTAIASGSSAYSNYAKFDWTDNGDGTVSVVAKEAGSIYNSYKFSVDADADSTTVIGDSGTSDIEGDNQTSEKSFSQSATTAGANGIFKSVSANNIADSAFSGVVTFGASQDGSGTVNGVKQDSTVLITAGDFGQASSVAYQSILDITNLNTVADVSNGVKQVSSIKITGPSSGGDITTDKLTFFGVDVGFDNSDTLTQIDDTSITTIDGQGAALAAKLNGLSDADGGLANIGNYTFDYDASTDTLTATRKTYAAQELTAVFSVTSANGFAGTPDFATTDVLGHAEQNDQVTFGGTTLTFKKTSADVSANTDIDASLYSTVHERADKIAQILNENLASDATVANYTFARVGNTVVATRNNYADGSGDTTFGYTNTTGGDAGTTSTVALDINRDTITFDGDTNTTITFVEAGQATSNRDIDVSIYDTADKQGQKIVDILNGLKDTNVGNTALYTFSYNTTSNLVEAKSTNYGAGIGSGTGNFASTVAGGGTLTATTDIGGGYEAGTATTATLRIRNSSNTDIASVAISVAANTGASVYSAVDIATKVAAYVNGNDNAVSRLFSVVDNGDGTLSIQAREKDLSVNDLKIRFDDDTVGDLSLATATTGSGTTILGANGILNVAGNTLATTKNIADADLTFDSNLEGALTNLQGTFNYNVDGNGNNTARFSVVVNGVTYTSQDVYLRASAASGTGSDTIAAGTLLTFQNASGPVDDNGAFTNNGFQIGVESAITLSSVTNSSTGQNALNSVVDSLQTQLDSITINEKRSIALDETDPVNSDHTLSDATGTILEGLKGFDAVGNDRLAYASGDITLTSNHYSDTGTHGRVGQFSIDATADTISTTIDGEIFTAYLNSGTAPTTGDVTVFGTDADGTDNTASYDTSSKVLTLGTATGSKGKLNFYSSDITDGRVLTVDLSNVYAAGTTTIDISTKANQTTLVDALDTVFGVATSDSTDASLSFQVGVASSDSITVTIGNAQTAGIYKDGDGVAQTIAVDTKAHAIEASDILDRALNTVVALVSTVSASITAFDASIQNNNSSIQNADAARSTLLDTDYTVESTKFAENRVRVDAATAVLAQINTRAANLLQLLRQ